MSGRIVVPCLLFGLLFGPLTGFSADQSMSGQDEELIIEDELLIEDEDVSGGELIIDDGETANGADELLIDEDGPGGSGNTVLNDDTALMQEAGEATRPHFSIDDLWLEGAYVKDSNSPADTQAYGKLAASLNYRPNAQWEMQLAARLDLHEQGGKRSFTDITGDYGDSYIRYRGDDLRLTLGSQTLIWGRIDELPPSDRVSTVDLRRLILDELPDRRLSTPMLRAEVFFESAKLDLVWLYAFREAELPNRDSAWYPVNKTGGQLLGITPPAALQPAFENAVRTGRFDTDAPNGEGGFAARYTRTQSDLDFGASLGRTRSSIPYFSFDAGDFEARHQRSWFYGVDAAFEAAGATWRFEAVYNRDTPVTRNDLSYTTVPAWTWGGGVEMHPGDGDVRVNLQLTGLNMVGAPSVLDRTEIYSFNGAVSAPFAHNRWRADLRFFLGLDEDDVYVNPKVSFVGWEPHELYLSLHYFDGDEGTLGGFYQDNSMLNLGWHAQF